MSKSAAVSQKELNRREFIVSGNIWKVVFVLMFPLFLYTIFNYIYSIIDTIMCSELNKDALNAVGPLNQITNMISAVGAGIASGGSILIAREIGRKDYEKAKRLSSTVFAIVFIAAIATVAIVVPLSGPILKLAGLTDNQIAIGRTYFIIAVASHAIIMINTVFLGVQKAKGSMTLVTLLNMGVVFVKVLLNVLFIYGLKVESMAYVSLATLLANSCLLIYVIVSLCRKSYLFHFSFKNIDFKKLTLKRMWSISFPIFLGKFIFSLGKVIINGLANTFGEDVTGALGVSNNMGGAITNPIGSVEDSTSSIISTNLGAGKTKRAVKAFLVGLTYALTIAIIGVALVTIFDKEITMFFARSIEDPAERAEYASHISQVFFFEKMGIITLAINSSVLGLLYGFQKTKVSMAINIARVFVFRLPSFLITKALLPDSDPMKGYKVCGISMGVSNICIGLVALIAAIAMLSRLKKKMNIKENNKMLPKEKKAEIVSYFSSFLSQYTNYKASKVWCYEDGVVLLGSYRMYKATHDKSYLDFDVAYFDKNIKEDGTLTGYDPHNGNTDDLMPGLPLTYVNDIAAHESYSKAIAKMNEQFAAAPRNSKGSFFHKGRYVNQVWLDGLYMMQPYYALQACKNHDSKALSDVMAQFENVEKYNRDEKGNYIHGYDDAKAMVWANKDTGRSQNVWLRSVGWLAMALTDTAIILSENGHHLKADKLKAMLKEVIDSLLPYEDENHMFKDLPLVDDPRNYSEASGTLMISYACMRGAREKLLPYEYMAKGTRLFDGVVNHSFKGGHLNDIVCVSGLDEKGRDGSVAYYLSEKVVSDDSKGVGPFMMAYSEYINPTY